MAPEKLFDAALALPPEARLEFASKLLASVEDGPSEDWTQAWLAECDARVAAADSGAEAPVPWDEAYGRLHARLAQR
jgi:putative addiction module component (TIGR02574 family)